MTWLGNPRLCSRHGRQRLRNCWLPPYPPSFGSRKSSPFRNVPWPEKNPKNEPYSPIQARNRVSPAHPSKSQQARSRPRTRQGLTKNKHSFLDPRGSPESPAPAKHNPRRRPTPYGMLQPVNPGSPPRENRPGKSTNLRDANAPLCNGLGVLPKILEVALSKLHKPQMVRGYGQCQALLRLLPQQ